MDYDDDDISRHNLQLTGEGRSKTSSVLRPYDFPKFDFDDSLQAHLRFDSLVETEVFLGIQSQEDNQWIEDFSRGSNGMEFNSTPADSCSISRRNNVWSEATSSESVEMLLKSVGQEEMVPGESCILDSNACCDQDTFVKHVEPGSEPNRKNDECIVNADASLQQGELCRDYPALRTHVHKQLPEAEVPFVTQANVGSVLGEGGTAKHERQHSYHDDNLQESKTSTDKSPTCETGKDSVHFTGPVDNVDSDLGVSEQGKHACSGTGQKDTKILKEVAGEASVPIRAVDGSHKLAAEPGELNSKDSVETSHVCFRETVDRASNGGSKKPSEGDDKNMTSSITSQTGKHEVKVLPINSEIADSFKECQDGLAVDDTTQHSTDSGHLNAGHCPSTEHKMDSSVLLTSRRDDGKVEAVQTSAIKNESTYEAPSNSLDDNKALPENSDCIDMTKTCISSDIVVLACAAENKGTENVEGCHSVVTVGEPSAHIPTAIVNDSRQGIEENLVNRNTDVSVSESGQDICKPKEGVKQLFTSGGNMDFQMLTNNLRSQSVDESIEVAANDVASHARSDTLTEQDDQAENRREEPDAVRLSHVDDDCEETPARLVSDTNFMTVVSCAQSDVSVTDDVGRTTLSEMVEKSPQIVEESSDISSSGFPSVEAINPLYSNHSQVHMGGDKLSLNESVDDDLVNGENYEVAKVAIEGEKGSAQAAEVDKASCGSPTIISSSEPSPMEKDNQDEIKGSEVRDQFVKDVQFTSEDPKRKDATEDDTSFTFKVNALPDTIERETGNSWSPFSNAEKCNSSVVVEETKLSGGVKTARTPKRKTSHQSTQVSDGEHVLGTSKGTSGRKGRRSSGKGMAKENTKKGNQVKDMDQESAKGDKTSNSLLGTFSIQNVQFGNAQHYGHVEKSNTKPSGAASLPDLNASALNNSNSQSTSFRQPFTDLQQVQLRAQIFVYGSLIQGTAPDEACMVSAFGSSDGRSIWEPVWQAAVERVRSQKPSSVSAETPLHSESGARVSDAAAKEGSHIRTMLLSPVARTSSKGTPAAVVNSFIPLSSPLWSISTPVCDNMPSSGTHKVPIMDYQQASTPLHSYHTPPIRNFVGHTSWPSQSCFPSPWLASPQTSNSNVRFQPVTMTETVKLTPVKDTSGPLTSGVKHVTSSPVPTASPNPIYVGVSLAPDPKSMASTERHSLDSKTRKRKKVQASVPSQVSLLSEAQTTQIVVDSNVAAIPSSPAVVPAPASLAPPASDAVFSSAAANAVGLWCADHSKKGDLNAGKAFPSSEETLSKVAEAKSQAEDAATLAAAAVSHSEDLWGQLSKQKESGLTSEVEFKIASAAVAITAAASVAKAAAAAAKVACNVALQAKLMADEAFLSGKMSGLVPFSEKYTDVCDIGNATPASILKGDKITNQSSSILLVAKEAAKRRVEAASAASKQAENLDAIVKAAELAAAAVSQAGIIVAMGEPLPLSDLLDTGSEGYWKLTQPTSAEAEKPRESSKSATGTEDGAVFSAKSLKEDSLSRKGIKTVAHGEVHPRDRSNDSLVSGIMPSMHTSESELRSSKECKASDTLQSSGVVSKPDPSPASGNFQNDHDELVGAVDGIKKGSSVEVFKHGDGLRSAWYLANVLMLEDGKAYVSYTDLPSEEGSGNLCEWVPLEGEVGKPPIIRAAYPLTALQSQGTRKRRRAVLGDYAWCVGDRVDAWIDDCWWEGVVTEKFDKDETTLKVHFPVQDETSVVRTWNLRTSRSWNDGKWVEVSSSKGDNASGQSDMPQEKRQKLGIPSVPSKEMDKLANDVDPVSGKPEESKSLDLSTSDRIFNVGKTTKEDNKYAARRPLRSGLQKEGSRVIFGVPKPTGKKRKFMEVSKQFPANKGNKNNEINDSVKFAKYLMPQPTAARGWKVPSRNDSKEKRTADSRARVPSSRKSNRTLPRRDNLSSTLAQVNENKRDRGKDIEHSVGHDEDTSEKVKHGSSLPDEVAEAPLSSLIAQSLSTSSKKTYLSNTKSERLNRGRAAPSGKLSKIEEEKVYAGNSGQSVSEVTEPRRSNRRFQPTHRLLEGLQSSMVIPKMTSVSHDRGQKNPSRNVSRGKQL